MKSFLIYFVVMVTVLYITVTFVKDSALIFLICSTTALAARSLK